MKCSFKKYYTEPKEKYVCMSTSLFFKDNYIKYSKDLDAINVTKNKMMSYYNNLKETEKLLSNGTYPSNFYLRIYYDKSIYKIDKYIELFSKFKTNNKIQLVEFNCEYFKSHNVFHISLFGTLVRFYTIFDEESKNMEYCIFTDSDNVYTKNFFDIFNTFKKSKKIVYAFNKITQIAFHGNDYMDDNDFFDYIYLLAGAAIIKKDKIFDKIYWTKYFDNMFYQNDLLYIFNYMDFKKYAINTVLDKEQLKQDSYYAFNYGADEIWLNYVIKKILIDNNKKDKLDLYITKDYSYNLLLNRLNDLFKYNSVINTENFKIFLNKCSFLKDKSYNKLSEYIINLQKDENKIINFFTNLKNNDDFHRLYIFKVI